MPTRYMLRRGDSSTWESRNPVLYQGEPGYDETNNRLKIGSGSKWNDTKYLSPQVIDDLTTGGSADSLSAEQGKILKTLVDLKAAVTDLNDLVSRMTAFETEIKDGVVEEAPKDSKKYMRCNGAWVASTESSSSGGSDSGSSGGSDSGSSDTDTVISYIQIVPVIFTTLELGGGCILQVYRYNSSGKSLGGCRGYNLTFTSSNPSVVTITRRSLEETGWDVSAKARGSVVLTAQYNDSDSGKTFTATYNITVV